MKKLNKRGFSINELGVLGMALVLIAAVGFVLLKSHKVDKGVPIVSSEVQRKTYTDTANKFTFSYPGDWSLEYPQNAGDGDKLREIDYIKESRPVYVIPKGADSSAGNYVLVSGDCISLTDEKRINPDQFNTFQDLTINGTPVVYNKLDFKGDAESYLDHTYEFNGTNTRVCVNYRQNWHHPMSNTDFDHSANMAGFMSVVNSLKLK